MKKICVVTTTRADYGIMRNTMEKIHNDKELSLCLLVSGTHLSDEFGLTVEEIISDGLPIAEEIEILSNRSGSLGIDETMANAMLRFGEAYNRHHPDLVIVMGDRYELIPICMAALVANIPIAHVSGGEITEGAIDDCVRHCVTKMSTLHFPACEEYKRRIIQLGEQPDRVFNYGDPGVENILNTDFISRNDLELDLGISLENCICMTFHPVTTQTGSERQQLEEVLYAIEQFPQLTFVITKANADNGGQYINDRLEQYEKEHDNARLFASLGIRRYLSLVKYSKAVIGNSSSGIVEAPVLKTPTVNIGDRQKGRLMADSIISCATKRCDIVDAINRAISDECQKKAETADSLYGTDQTSACIVKTIKSYLNTHPEYEVKRFYDLI